MGRNHHLTDEGAQQGYRLHRIRGYANSGLFAAIWVYP
jgi:hypothetical protein